MGWEDGRGQRKEDRKRTSGVAGVGRDDDGESLLLDVGLELLDVEVVSVVSDERRGDRDEAPGEREDDV